MDEAEEDVIDDIVRLLIEFSENKKWSPQNNSDLTTRVAHPKAFGVLKAELTVLPDLDEKYQVGFFKQVGQTFPCWIRVSNGIYMEDDKYQTRGFAIKVMKEDGTPFGQDFVLLSSPVLTLKNPKEFRDGFWYRLHSWVPFMLAKFYLEGDFKNIYLAAAQPIYFCPDDALNVPYFSVDPFSFGEKTTIVKYHLTPTHKYDPPKVKRGPNYLREVMTEHLKENDATYDFGIQFRKPGMPLDDASVDWSVKESPVIKLATIKISPQDFSGNARFGEELSYSPINHMKEHYPLGAMNRVRNEVYKRMSVYRHGKNKLPNFE